MTSQHFGEGVECSASRGAGRYTVLVLIASLVAILLWLIGTAAERRGMHERMRPGNRKRRAYSRLFLARLLLTLEDCRTIIAELVDAIRPPDQWWRVSMMRCSWGDRREVGFVGIRQGLARNMLHTSLEPSAESPGAPANAISSARLISED